MKKKNVRGSDLLGIYIRTCIGARHVPEFDVGQVTSGEVLKQSSYRSGLQTETKRLDYGMERTSHLLSD